MVGATPKNPQSSAWTMFKARPTATPASMALPPRLNTSRPAMEALGWLETTTPLTPWIWGRKLLRVVPGTGMRFSLTPGIRR